MLPLTLLKTAENHPMLVELKNGDTYNGRLASCNMFMNICLKDVICTSRDGDRFWKMPECYIRGNSIKYLRIPDEVIDLVPEEDERERKAAFRGGPGGRGGRGGRGGDNNNGRGGGRGNDESSGRGVGRGGGRDGAGGRGGGRFAGRGEGRGDGRGGGREGSQGRGGGSYGRGGDNNGGGGRGRGGKY